MIRDLLSIFKSRYLILFYLMLAVLYAWVGYFSPGYDDEIYNIRLIEKFGISSVLYVQENDVHPPGSYLINWIIYECFRDWNLVRLVSSLFSCLCLIYAIESIRTRYGEASGLLAFILLGLNPAFLLWCTGIRWYAYFVPLLLIACITPLSSKWWYWAKLFICLVLLAYIGYAAFVIAPALFYLYWNRSRQSTREKIKSVSIFLPFSGLLYSYQLYTFLTVHLANKDSQVFSLFKSFVGFVIAQISNQGVFPISFAGCLAAFGTAGLFMLSVSSSLDKGRRSEYLIPYWLGVACIVLSGLAGKARNFVVLSPLQALWFSTLIIEPGKKKYWIVCMSFIAMANIVGVVNVLSHKDTTKNSWNLPVNELMEIVHESQIECKNLLFMSHDPVITFNLERNGFTVVGPFSREPMTLKGKSGGYDCVIAMKTYAGVIKNDRLEKMYAELQSISHSSKEIHYLGKDSNFKLKQKLDKRYPEYQVEMVLLRDATGLEAVNSWTFPL